MDITLSFPEKVLALGFRSGAVLLFGDIYHHHKLGLEYNRYNREISQQFGVSERTVTNWFSELEGAGLIFREVERGRGIRRLVYGKD